MLSDVILLMVRCGDSEEEVSVGVGFDDAVASVMTSSSSSSSCSTSTPSSSLSTDVTAGLIMGRPPESSLECVVVDGVVTGGGC